MERAALEIEPRVAIVGAGGYGRTVLDVLLAAGFESWILGFYDDAHKALVEKIRGFPVLGDIAMLKSMLSVETVQVIVAITDNKDRLRVANSIRALGGQFMVAVHPAAYVSEETTLGDGCVVAAGAVVHPDSAIGSHCYVGPNSTVDRDVQVGAGAWISPGAVLGTGSQAGARSLLGQNCSVGRKAVIGDDVVVGMLEAVPPRGEV
ncbi:MAG: DapH/DapD/GlmU-related protein [Rubrobacteraceae bacterium]